jgi:hypothetical protein
MTTTTTATGAMQTEAVLLEESLAIHGDKAKELSTAPNFYRGLFQLESAALCLSGGGIRAAAFSLGVIQALASHPRCASSAGHGRTGEAKANDCLLGEFHYLSTVSGGGYIGSWLSAWRKRRSFDGVWQGLVHRQNGVEAEAISWLRSYSNYLTPRAGLTSADTWAAAAIYVFNLLLTWLIIFPVFCGAILLLKIVLVLLDSVALIPNFSGPWYDRALSLGIPLPRHLSCNIAWQPYVVIGITGLALLTWALSFATHYRPSRREPPPAGAAGPQGPREWAFIFRYLVLSLFSAIAVTHCLSSDAVGKLMITFDPVTCENIKDSAGLLIPKLTRLELCLWIGSIGIVTYAVAWLFGWPWNLALTDFLIWAVSGFAYGSVVAFGVFEYLRIPEVDATALAKFIDSPAMPLVLLVSWVLVAQFISHMVFVGLSITSSDADREWLGRAGGWLLAAGIGWFVITFIVFAGMLAVLTSGLPAEIGIFFQLWFPVISGVAGLLTALLSRSPLSRAAGQPKDIWSYMADIVLAISGPLFLAGLIFILSVVLDHVLLGQNLFENYSQTDLVGKPDDERAKFSFVWKDTLQWLLLGLGLSVIVGWIASRRINVNRFSLHALYRNRLVRAFLGASRDRAFDALTGFDSKDDFAMAQLRPASGGGARHFHVINMTLNVVSSRRLSWQERKAQSFTVSPLHSGTGINSNSTRMQGGYRKTAEYGGPEGISLGTAMAISGAAASPNMGYHSSPFLTFLMTILNVRLGWWLGNPGGKGDQTYRNDGPAVAVVLLLQEAFGLTTDDKPYVYLSDGGHFENLGLYEMVRRRCRFILISDAGRDPKFGFEDLGNAVRKIEIDFGIPIRFYGLEVLKARPDKQPDRPLRRAYHAVGEILYDAVDDSNRTVVAKQPAGSPSGANCAGLILYVKAGYQGVEGTGIRSYAFSHHDFPHESTVDQWYSESQFESYRALGFEIMNNVLDRGCSHSNTPLDLPKIFERLLEQGRSQAVIEPKASPKGDDRPAS